MSVYSLRHLSDRALLQQLNTLAARGRATTAELLAHIAETDARQLYREQCYPSMHLYCVRELCLSEDEALKRIRVARVAREFPAVFEALAGGQLHSTAVLLLAPKLTRENATDLLAAAAGKSKAEIERLLAERFPRPDLPTVVGPASGEVALEPVGGPTPRPNGELAPEPPRSRVLPLAPGRVGLQVTIGEPSHAKLLRARALLRRRVVGGDIAEVLDRALDALIEKLEKQKRGAGSRPARVSRNPRRISSAVRHAVWQRDGGQCTFTAEGGRRCPARDDVEFDHVLEVARGGTSAAENLRLRCRAHNQLTAERTFGAGFMDQKRRAAEEKAAIAAQERELGYALHKLGYRRDEIRHAAALCAQHASAPLEERFKLVFRSLAPTRGITRVPAPA